jgi:hypothetical protein
MVCNGALVAMAVVLDGRCRRLFCVYAKPMHPTDSNSWLVRVVTLRKTNLLLLKPSAETRTVVFCALAFLEEELKFKSYGLC